MSKYDDAKPSRTSTTSDQFISRWEQVSREQDTIVAELITRNKELESQVKTLEYENWMNRTLLEKLKADSAKDNAKQQDLQKEIHVLRSKYEGIKNSANMAICLLDGDGCIFTEDLLRQGCEGGREAARRLLAGLTENLHATCKRLPPNPQIVVMVFSSRTGLEWALTRNGTCTAKEFTDFLDGFVSAHPLISVIDVGSGKEAADTKLREYLNIYIKMPQTLKVYFGGGHDNGYYGSLAAIQTMGLQEKLVVLQSYSQMGAEIGKLRLPVHKIDDLFMTEKLDSRPTVKPRPRSDSVLPDQVSQASSTRKKKKSKKKNQVTAHHPEAMKSDPCLLEDDMDGIARMPCLRHYLSDQGCRQTDCPFEHDEDLTPDELQDLKEMASAMPCEYVKSNRPCELRVCYFAHKCTRGPTCEPFLRGSCPFTGRDMHN
ncbi:hypothetical protein CPB86DRAFT_572919 [Serendipita vermifera]|nr:hypothetical protein CPB86DRAFT_572919 [Serendipita vermifera]